MEIPFLSRPRLASTACFTCDATAPLATGCASRHQSSAYFLGHWGIAGAQCQVVRTRNKRRPVVPSGAEEGTACHMSIRPRPIDFCFHPNELDLGAAPFSSSAQMLAALVWSCDHKLRDTRAAQTTTSTIQSGQVLFGNVLACHLEGPLGELPEELPETWNIC